MDIDINPQCLPGLGAVGSGFDSGSDGMPCKDRQGGATSVSGHWFHLVWCVGHSAHLAEGWSLCPPNRGVVTLFT